MNKISPDEVKKFPYIDQPPTDGRAVLECMYYDHTAREWILCLVEPSGVVECGTGVVPYRAEYLACQAEASSDLEFPLGTFVFQALSFPAVLPQFQKVKTSVQKLATIVGTIDLIEQAGFPDQQRAALIAASQLEHLVISVRSTYDLLQKVIKSSAALIHDLKNPTKKLVQQLPDSFAQVVLDGDAERGADQIVARFKLPPPLAKYYADLAPEFSLLRDLRVGIEHHGKSVPNVYVIDDELAVPIREKPWSQLQDWEGQELRVEGRFGSFRSVYAHLVIQVLHALTGFEVAFRSCVKCPPELNPGIRMFIRHPFAGHLLDLERIGHTPWRNPAPQKDEA